MIRDGASRTEAAGAPGLELQILRDGVLRDNAERGEGLTDRPRGGSAGRLTEAQITESGLWGEAGPDLERDGVTRWRVQDMIREIEEAFGGIDTESGARMMLRRAGVCLVSGRPVHPRADAERQGAFVTDFEAKVTSLLSAEALAGPIEIWFPAEARLGQTGGDDAGLGAGEATSAHRARPSLWLRRSVRRHLGTARRRHRPCGGQGEHGGDERASGGGRRGHGAGGARRAHTGRGRRPSLGRPSRPPPP